ATCHKSEDPTRSQHKKICRNAPRVDEDMWQVQLQRTPSRDALFLMHSLCRRLKEDNTHLINRIKNQEQEDMSCASQRLGQYNRVGDNVLVEQLWTDHQLDGARQELQVTRVRKEEHMKGLLLQLQAVDKALRDAQNELRQLKTFRDIVRPASVLEILELKRQLHKLSETYQDQADDVTALSHSELNSFLDQQQKVKESALERVVQDHMTFLPPSLKRASLQNKAMKRDIDIHRQMISELQDQIAALLKTGDSLRKSQSQATEHLCRDLLLYMPSCSPDQNLVFDILLEEDMAI
ncbi:uncharacterized protein C20orf96 homolog, partial [Discoglossus pictus]